MSENESRGKKGYYIPESTPDIALNAGYYTPEATPDIAFHAHPPSKHRDINRVAVASLLTLASLTLLGVACFIVYKKSLRKQELLARKQEKSMSDYVPLGSSFETRQLPQDYGEYYQTVGRREKTNPKAEVNYARLQRRVEEERLPIREPKNREAELREKLLLKRLEAIEKGKRAPIFSAKSTSYQRQTTRSSSLPASAVTNDAMVNQILSGLSTNDDQNMQSEKIAFADRTRDEETQLTKTLQESGSPYQLMGGTIISGVLETGINSDLPGPIAGRVTRNIYDSIEGQHLLLPQGTRVIGTYSSQISYGQERVLITWTRLVLPNGKSISLEGMPGTDMSGYAGLRDQVNNHYGKVFSGVVLGSILGAGAQVAQGTRATNINPDFGELALQGASRNINDAGQQITRKNINIQPTLEIRPGMEFQIFVTKDITLEPYLP